MDISKYRGLFVAECREHLEATARQLVNLETTPADERAGLFDEILRHVHSVKGMSASMGYEPIAALAHRLEDAIGALRDGDLRHEAIDLVLRGVDALHGQVNAIDSEQALSEEIELLRALREASDRRAPTAALARLEAPLRSREFVVQLAESTVAPEVRAFIVHRRVEEMVAIGAAEPSLEAIKAGALISSTLRFRVDEPCDDSTLRERLLALPDVDSVVVNELAAVPARDGRGPGASGPVSSDSVRVATHILDGLIDTVGELFIERARLASLLGRGRPDVEAALDGLAARIRDIHAQVMAVRMVPLRTVTDRHPRLVRDLARALNKDVVLEVDGGDIELDRAILDHLDTPFLHVLRNAVDHGLEPAAERLARGKSAQGRVWISATRDRDAVIVMVQDDGRGLDPELLRRRAVELGMLRAEEAELLSARELYSLICTPGFSTKGSISDLSGRGVGMDAVRQTIEGLGGGLDISSEVGHGTRISFRLPLTLAIIPVLLIEAAGRVFAVPAAKVVAVREPGNDIFEQAGGNAYLSFQHALILIRPLSMILGLAKRARIAHVVVLEDARDLHAIAVDRILGYQEVVVKSLGDPLDRLETFSGATVLGDGQPILILDVPRALRARVAA